MSWSSFSDIDFSIERDAPFNSLFLMSPRFAASAAPAAFCWDFDFAGMCFSFVRDLSARLPTSKKLVRSLLGCEPSAIHAAAAGTKAARRAFVEILAKHRKNEWPNRFRRKKPDRGAGAFPCSSSSS
jgi:hypothetical protein